MGVTKTATKQTLPGENREGNQINTRAFEGLSRNNRDPQKCACGNTGVHHVGLYAKDPSASAKFYRDLLNMQIVGGSGPENPLGASAFLCSRP
ncbi:MAG: VOC family protein, partial [Acidobacteriaceae bacterium]|nr:VOC family protein [Acidobacteriaceae bacterium]